jgi:beta-RFAP synthase
MVQHPELVLKFSPAEKTQAVGSGAERAMAYASRWAEFHGREPPGCLIEICQPALEHVGLGSGTQLALSVAAGLNALYGLPNQTPQELALSVGRGLRSAVGTYGFVFGGLIVEQGKLPSEPISPLDCRIDLPETWRFVLVLPQGMGGLAGEEEVAAFTSLPAAPVETTEALIGEVRDRLVPAAATADFALFAESLYRYGRLSGECFAARQGGPYNGPVLTALVDRIRSLGIIGVGQSSWGPTIFAVAPSQQAAEEIRAELYSGDDAGQLEVTISPPCNRGARIEVSGESPGELAEHG